MEIYDKKFVELGNGEKYTGRPDATRCSATAQRGWLRSSPMPLPGAAARR